MWKLYWVTKMVWWPSLTWLKFCRGYYDWCCSMWDYTIGIQFCQCLNPCWYLGHLRWFWNWLMVLIFVNTNILLLILVLFSVIFAHPLDSKVHYLKPTNKSFAPEFVELVEENGHFQDSNQGLLKNWQRMSNVAISFVFESGSTDV